MDIRMTSHWGLCYWQRMKSHQGLCYWQRMKSHQGLCYWQDEIPSGPLLLTEDEIPSGPLLLTWISNYITLLFSCSYPWSQMTSTDLNGWIKFYLIFNQYILWQYFSHNSNAFHDNMWHSYIFSLYLRFRIQLVHLFHTAPKQSYITAFRNTYLCIISLVYWCILNWKCFIVSVSHCTSSWYKYVFAFYWWYCRPCCLLRYALINQFKCDSYLLKF